MREALWCYAGDGESHEHPSESLVEIHNGLSNHPQKTFNFEDIHSVEAYWTNGEDEPSFAWLLKLRDGYWVAATGGHDYTGWDCRSGLETSVHATKEDAIRFGLTLNDRDNLKLLLPEDKP